MSPTPNRKKGLRTQNKGDLFGGEKKGRGGNFDLHMPAATPVRNAMEKKGGPKLRVAVIWDKGKGVEIKRHLPGARTSSKVE